MPALEEYFDEIDAARQRRARQLSEVKSRFTAASADPLNIGSQAVIVLTYASWEGFYNECADVYMRFLKFRGGKVRDTEWMLLLGALNSDLESLKDKNHSDDARQTFIENLQSRLECGFDQVNARIISTRSNLDFSRLRWNYKLLNFDVSPFERHRLKLDRELVQWRHNVAHGNPPDLTALSISDHVEFARQLLLALADGFQQNMLDRYYPNT